jgi:hypothetical protein
MFYALNRYYALPSSLHKRACDGVGIKKARHRVSSFWFFVVLPGLLTLLCSAYDRWAGLTKKPLCKLQGGFRY